MGKRTTQLGEITTIDDNDILYGVDVSDLTHSPDGTSNTGGGEAHNNLQPFEISNYIIKT